MHLDDAHVYWFPLVAPPSLVRHSHLGLFPHNWLFFCLILLLLLAGFLLLNVLFWNCCIILYRPSCLTHSQNILFLTEDITYFMFSNFPSWVVFGDITPIWILIFLRPRKDLPWAKTRRINHKLWKFIYGFELGVCPRKKQYN